MIAEDSVRFAHSGPSHCYLRHRCAITCYQRAPPATRVRGWTRLRNHCYHPSQINWIERTEAVTSLLFQSSESSESMLHVGRNRYENQPDKQQAGTQ